MDGTHALLAKRDPRAVHLVKTLHKGAGDRFEAGILQDIECRSILQDMECRGILEGRRGSGLIEALNADGSLVLSLALTEDAPPRLPIAVAVGFCRPIEMRRLFRDLSSLGVAAIDVFGTDSGEASYRDTTLFSSGGARAALIEGAVQSRDTTLPRLTRYPTLDAWLQTLDSGAALRAACDNVRPEGSLAAFFHARNAENVILALGSERGWSDRERTLLETSGFHRLSLGNRALRTETACVVAAALAVASLAQGA